MSTKKETCQMNQDMNTMSVNSLLVFSTPIQNIHTFLFL